MKHKIESITLEMLGGERIDEAIRDAGILSLEQDCEVHFVFNDTPVVVDARPIIHKAYKEWAEQRGER
jgi:hypothetical protein